MSKPEQPKRIQRKRTRGWRMPPNTVYVGRPTKWGNPFYIGHYFMRGDPCPESAGAFRMIWCHGPASDPRMTRIESREQAIEWFRWLCEARPFAEADLAEIRGKDLACWCPLDQLCHADVLLELANPLPDAEGGA